MPVIEWAAGAVLATCMALAVIVTIWLWRDMRERGRPRWLCAVVVVATFLFAPAGLSIFIFDEKRHPHHPDLSIRDRVAQWRSRPRRA